MHEAHTSEDRAGFSVIILSDDRGGSDSPWGIELAFWLDEIWAQDDDRQSGTLFTHAEGVSHSALLPNLYHLAIISDTYTLSADDSVLLSGRLRDYSNFAGIPDPYETPNLLFLGDNTTSAAGRVKIDYVAITNAVVKTDFDELIYLPLLKRPQ